MLWPPFIVFFKFRQGFLAIYPPPKEESHQAYHWMEQGLSNLMHPDTLSHRWRALMLKLEMSYELHEIRHTWITRARLNIRPVKFNWPPVTQAWLLQRGIATTIDQFSAGRLSRKRPEFRPVLFLISNIRSDFNSRPTLLNPQNQLD